MPRNDLLEILLNHFRDCQHPHLFEGAEGLSLDLLERFSQEARGLSSELFLQQQQALQATAAYAEFEPWIDIEAPSESLQGRSLLEGGKVACVILAGGQGSRLGWHGPKALYPIFPENNVTLLQILMEKVRKANMQYKCSLPVAVMTSPLHRASIEEHAHYYHFYGLAPEQLSFFSQSMQPLLDEQGRWFLEEPGRIAMGPDGNGRVFLHLLESGILERWKALGIQSVTVIPIDNPLALPFDECLIGSQNRGTSDVAAKCIQRHSPEEKVGVFAKSKGQLHVIEYSEISPEQKQSMNQQGLLQWPYANINLFSFSLSFIERIARVMLPWHIARKQARAWQFGDIPVAKCETFLFDVLPFARNPKLLLYPRESIYAPLKNKEGEKSPATVRAMLKSL
ncbi:MAG: UTP--glucose-1-phosphate uridylyltransferase [Anaplasmataceae bacterium]|nr:UTP--glucose-1-phosphate uridylyltransferase [Anaplasmataceae bacterium]